jgi:hypothetical protein
MICSKIVEIYDLGIYDSCGEQELNLIIPIPGIYTLHIQIGNIVHKYAIQTTAPNQKPSINFSLLPINREMILSVINPVTQQFLTFDIEINGGTGCDPILETRCFYIFKFKSNIFNYELS